MIHQKSDAQRFLPELLRWFCRFISNLRCDDRGRSRGSRVVQLLEKELSNLENRAGGRAACGVSVDCLIRTNEEVAVGRAISVMSRAADLGCFVSFNDLDVITKGTFVAETKASVFWQTQISDKDVVAISNEGPGVVSEQIAVFIDGPLLLSEVAPDLTITRRHANVARGFACILRLSVVIDGDSFVVESAWVVRRVG